MLLMLVGLLMRLMAFYTAKANFTHLVQYEKKPSHVLVTDGIYKYLRHPGYTGFYYFSIGSMMFIGNPICFFAYAMVLYSFFKQRIAYCNSNVAYSNTTCNTSSITTNSTAKPPPP
jgi:protein-S-isoprenylcysteine O-methyltransferase